MSPVRSSSLVTVSQIADLAEVGPSAVSNWRKRFSDFPSAVQTAAGGRDLFELEGVEQWLAQHGRLASESKGKRLIFEAADSLRAEVAAGPMVEILGAALALVAVERRRTQRESEEQPSVESLLTAAATVDPDLAEVFSPLREIDRRAAKRILSLVVEVDVSDLSACFDWVVSRRHQPLDAHSSDVLTGLLVTLIGDEGGVVYDPAAGSGGFLLALWRATAGAERPRLCGQELRASAWRIARQRSLVHDVPVSLVRGDSLLEDGWPELRADVVVCDPPYSSKKSWPANSTGDPRWISGRPPARTDFAWLQHVAYHLSQAGRGFVFLPIGSLFRRGREADLRRELLAEGVVEAIVGLPPGSAHNTGIPLALWILRRPGGDEDRDAVLLLDSTALGSSPRAMLDSEAMTQMAEVLREWRAGQGISDQDRAFAASVPVLELLRGEVNLAPARWIGSDLTAADRGRQEAEFAENLHDLDRSRAALAPALAIPSPAPGRSSRQWIRIDQLVEGRAAQIIRGVRIKPEDCVPAGAPVVRPGDVFAGLAGNDGPRFVDPASIGPQVVLTMPGDVVLAAAKGRLTAVVDRQGGRVLASPLQGLRLERGSMDPEIVAAFLESPRNRRLVSGTVLASVRLRDLEVPVLPSDEARELLASLEGLREQERLADRVGSSSRRLRELLLGLASSSFVAGDLDE